MRQYGEGSVRIRGSKWYVRLRINGKSVERPTAAKSRKEAIAIRNELRAGATKGTLTADCLTVRVHELYDALCESYRVEGKRVGDLAKRWLHLEPVFGRDRALAVTSPRLRAYVTARLGEGAAPATVQRELACLKRMLNLGREDARVITVPAFPAIQVHNVRTGFVDHDTFDKLTAALPEPVRTMAIVGFYTGWRFGELSSLQWRQVDLQEGTVRLDPGTTKNKDGRKAYLPGPALDAIQAWREVTGAHERETQQIVRSVFHRNGRQVKSIRGAWESACEEAGCPGLLFHDLRRSAARNLIRAGVPETVAMKITGHRTRSMLDRYNITADGDLKNAADAVGQLRIGATCGQVETIAPAAPVANTSK